MNINVKIIFEEDIDESFKIIENEILKESPMCDRYKITRNVFGQTMLVLNNNSNIIEIPVKLINNIIEKGLTLNTIISNYKLP